MNLNFDVVFWVHISEHGFSDLNLCFVLWGECVCLVGIVRVVTVWFKSVVLPCLGVYVCYLCCRHVGDGKRGFAHFLTRAGCGLGGLVF